MITMEEYVRQVNTNIELSQEIEKLHSIIKEAREYIKENILVYEYVDQLKHYHNATTEDIDNILEILNKVGSDK